MRRCCSWRCAGYDERDPYSIAGPVPDLLAACRQDVKGLRIAYSPTLGYARPDAEVLRVVEAAAKQFEDLGCTVELVERVFERDPVDIWSAEFYAGAGTRLRPFLEGKRELIDPAVADILEQALRQELRDYYGKVFERYALRDELRPFFERYDILLSPVLPVTVARRRQERARPSRRPQSGVVGLLHLSVQRDRPAGGDGLRRDRAGRHAGRLADRRSRHGRTPTWCGLRRPMSVASPRAITCVRSMPDRGSQAVCRVSLSHGKSTRTAATAMALRYESGRGVQFSASGGGPWLRHAAAHGNNPAPIAIDELVLIECSTPVGDKHGACCRVVA